MAIMAHYSREPKAPLDIDTIALRLKGHTPTLHKPQENTREAAVAVVLRPQAQGTDILFIKRAERDGDPWSGHMAFPGGHREPSDGSLEVAAQRETLEEIGLDLTPARYLGALDHQRAMPRGRTLDMLVAPHVWVLEETNPEFRPNYEVDDVVWANMPDLLSNDQHDTELWPMAGKPTVFNGYRLPTGHFVWGLTYRMLKTFFNVVDPTWQPPTEVE